MYPVSRIKYLRFCALIFFSLYTVYSILHTNWLVYASHCKATEYDCQLDEIKSEIDALQPAQQKNQQELSNLKKQIADIKKRIVGLQNELASLEADINSREEDLGLQQELLDIRARSLYIRSRLNSPLLVFLASSTASEFTRELTIRQQAAEEDNKVINDLSDQLVKLTEDKKKLQTSRASLEGLQKSLDSRATFLGQEVEKVGAYLAQLSAKQNEILAARSGQFTASIGDSELADDFNASIKGFREAAPSGSFGVFSFGGYTHRKGMSQYGARGRAQSGQDYKAILKAYYGKEPVSKDTGGDITVSGYGAMNFEEKYLYGIAEMPSSWHADALKAQAVAARTYAYRYKTQGNSICTTEACQVFSKLKSDNPPQAWRDAVNATRGQVVEDVVTFYASTHGGYATTMGWDTTDGGGGSNFVDKSYDKSGGSPWVYKAWYTQGYSPSSDKCGRSNPWLNGEEMADIVNAALVIARGTSEEAARVTPISSCWGGNPYSHDELKNVASKYGGISSASLVSVSQGTGTTASVNINGVSLSGAEFKKGFNLRAPGRLSIPQSGFAFFNIEKK